MEKAMNTFSWIDLMLAMLGGAVRVGTPFLFVSLGECITEKSGRINLGLEGVLVFSAMASFGVAYLSQSVWFGVVAAGCCGALLALLHGLLSSIPRVSDIATGIALMLLGTGLAFYLGKPLIQPQAPQIPSITLGFWSDSSKVQSALSINALFPIGLLIALVMAWVFANTKIGLIVRTVGDSSDAAKAIGFSVNKVRIAATTVGGFIAGLGGASLSLYYPGSWNEGLSSGQGLIAVALVIFARWHPIRCFWAALLFGGAGAIGPALQSVGISAGYNLFNAIPYVLTLAILVVSSSTSGSLRGAPAELGVIK
jgi:general nucleoside transport system permease protein